jgi:rubrerythrin
MTDPALTASAIMSYAEKLEEDSAAFYERLAERFEHRRESFLRFAKESKKNGTHLVRTYQETITDALEASYAFEGLVLPGFDFEALSVGDTSFEEALGMALEIEQEVPALYSKIADLAQALLATIPRAFRRVAKNRRARQEVLQSMLNEG